MEAYIMENMTWKEVEEALVNIEFAIIPVGAHEQHSPYIAESCDSVRAKRFSELLAKKMHPKSIVTPTINIGVSPHHMSFPGTITLKPSTLINLLFDIVKSLYKHGINKFVFLNSHGGNDSALGAAVDEIRADLDVSLMSFKYTSLAPKSIKKNIKSNIYGHACEREVSELLYLDPSIIRDSKIEKGNTIDEGTYFHNKPVTVGLNFDKYTKNGALGNAKKAEYKIGEEIINEALYEAEDIIEHFINCC